MGKSAAWAERRRGDLEEGDFIPVAERITEALGGPAGGEFGAWLRENLESLPIQDASVLEALAALDLPIVTTNYDTLLEQATGLPSITWQDTARVERVLRAQERAILHLHGVWDRPKTVILGIRDYDRVQGDAHAQVALQALRLMKTWVFVGCGEGLRDPNIGALLRWSRGVLASGQARHYRLARASEVASLRAEHPTEERIFVLGYGPGHGDLGPFLRSLVEAPPEVEPAPEPKPILKEAPPPLIVLSSYNPTETWQDRAPQCLVWAPHDWGDRSSWEGEIAGALLSAREDLRRLGHRQVLLHPKCIPGVALRAGAVFHQATEFSVRCTQFNAGSRQQEVWDLTETRGPLPSLTVEIVKDAAPEEMHLLVSVAQSVSDDWRAWRLTHTTPAFQIHIAPADGPGRAALRGSEDAVAWARAIVDALLRHRPSPRLPTRIFYAGPTGLAIAIGRELNAVGEIRVMDFLASERQYLESFTFTPGE